MLIDCPECKQQISDKALFCPHCGITTKISVEKSKKRRSPRHAKLPNGFGQITKLKSTNLKKPFRAMVTVGKNENGRPICKLLKPVSYFRTYNEAYEALIEYNKKEPGQKAENPTLKELLDEWIRVNIVGKLHDIAAAGVKSAMKNFKPLYEKNVKDLSALDFKNCIVEADVPVSTKRLMNIYIRVAMDYALERGCVESNKARQFKLPKEISKSFRKVSNEHISFTDDEMQILWSHPEDTSPILIQCYSGWRPLELVDLRIENINLDTWSFIGGCKTESGTNRVVPIHSKIKGFVKQLYENAVDNGRETLLDYNNYATYRRVFAKIMAKYNLNDKHRPHDCRKQFVTMAKKYGVDEYAIKRIVGHSISDLTESVYTDRDLEWLRSEIEKIL